jgi:hypothetical protein
MSAIVAVFDFYKLLYRLKSDAEYKIVSEPINTPGIRISKIGYLGMSKNNIWNLSYRNFLLKYFFVAVLPVTIFRTK